MGAAGRMGGWLSQYFARRGKSVTLYDKRHAEARKLARKLGQLASDDLSDALRESDMIFVSVSLDATPSVIEDLSNYLAGRKVIAEIASLKTDSVKALRTLKGKCSAALSIHPLFGPGVKSLRGKRIAFIPVFDREAELHLAKTLFPGADLIEMGADEHDQVMAATLGLTHFINAVYAKIIYDEGPERLRRLAGTSFALQQLVSQSIFHDDPSLLAAIQMGNRYGHKYLQRFIKEATDLAGRVGHDREATLSFFSTLRERMAADPAFKDSYRKAYAVLESIVED